VRRLKELEPGIEDEGAEGEEQYNPGNSDEEALVDGSHTNPHQQDGKEVEGASNWCGG
jgi:hypothetical protein